MTQVRSGLIQEEGTLFDRSSHGRSGVNFAPFKDRSAEHPSHLKREKPAALPECSEPDVIRHFTRLSNWNYSIDSGFYPLGSCTMKYNPRIHESIAGMPSFKGIHPLQPESTMQASLRIMHELSDYLSELTGLPAVSLQPAAGAQGEWTGLKLMAAYFKDHGQSHKKVILIPDSAHGTNPASAAMAGFECRTIETAKDGILKFEKVAPMIDDTVAGLMVTNPNTLGLFESEIHKIAEKLHQKGAFLYMDGANFNAIMGLVRPGHFGVDVVHINLHKTFSTPHGGGGPGAGPIAVCEKLKPYLPVPFVTKKAESYTLNWNQPKTIGSVKAFFGNFGMFIRAHAYVLAYGREHISQVAKDAVLNANYLLSLLRNEFEHVYGKTCMHEFVLTDRAFKDKGVTTLDIAKALIDRGYHPPTIYFPLVAPGALMIEPTETESKEELDRFAAEMLQILKTAKESPEEFKNLPQKTFIGKVDEASAARKLCLCD